MQTAEMQFVTAFLAEAIRTTVMRVKYPYLHDRRADKDSYPHDRNVTDDLCSLIKLYFAFIMVNFSTSCVLLLFMLKIIYFKKCLNH